jgi:hypothetical protein
MQPGKAERLREKYRGLSDRDRAVAALEDARTWAGPESDVYWVGSRREVQDLEDLLDQDLFEEVGEIRFPAAADGDERDGGRRAGRPALPGAPGRGGGAMFGLSPGQRLVVLRLMT